MNILFLQRFPTILIDTFVHQVSLPLFIFFLSRSFLSLSIYLSLSLFICHFHVSHNLLSGINSYPMFFHQCFLSFSLPLSLLLILFLQIFFSICFLLSPILQTFVLYLLFPSSFSFSVPLILVLCLSFPPHSFPIFFSICFPLSPIL